MASNSTNNTTDTGAHAHPVEESELDVKYWREGSDLVIERNKGPGDDVSLTTGEKYVLLGLLFF